jgi:HTH-type transcriptional regulator/antitoxin HigA
MTPTIAAPSGIDVKRYGRLLARFTPKVIETEAENDAALAIVEGLMEKGEDNLTAEERTIFELLTALIEQFEDRAYPVPDGDPKEVLIALMAHNGLKAADLAELLGSRAKVSEILSGARSISKEQAKRLGARFRVSPAIFI